MLKILFLSDLFFEVTGEDLDSVLVACNIFAQAMHDRNFKIFSVDVKYPNKKNLVFTQPPFSKTVEIDHTYTMNHKQQLEQISFYP